jgi:hypothetical protein
MVLSRSSKRATRVAVIVSALVVSTAACGGGSNSSSTPTAPTATPAAPTTAALTVQVVSLNGGAPVSGVAADANGVTATSDGQGTFSVTIPAGTTPERIVLTSPQILSRTVFVSRTTRTLRLDVIRTDDGGFDAKYYRQLVRNEFDSTTGLQALRRWTQSPSFYLKTVDEAGVTMDPQLVDMVEADIRLSVSAFTGGQFDVAAVERGLQTRETTAGWITVKWLGAPEPGVCGRAHVGLERGATIEFSYLHTSGCGCDGSKIRHKTVRHEVGHAMGFWHVDNTEDVMSNRNFSCHTMPTSRERFHAGIAYARPVGNMEPDVDPSTSIRSTAPMVAN